MPKKNSKKEVFWKNSGTEDIPLALISFLKLGRALPEDEKFYLMRRHAEGKLPKELDF